MKNFIWSVFFILVSTTVFAHPQQCSGPGKRWISIDLDPAKEIYIVRSDENGSEEYEGTFYCENGINQTAKKLTCSGAFTSSWFMYSYGSHAIVDSEIFNGKNGVIELEGNSYTCSQ